MRLNLYRRRRGGQGAAPAGPLQRIAPSWFYAPVRRAVQAACLAAFVALFLWACRPYAPAGSPAGVDGGRMVDPATFLMLDPLVSVLAAVASRAVVPGLVVAAGVLLIGLVFARGFCGYVCPMGAVIDLFDWALGRRVNRGRSLIPRGPWVHARYYLLAAALVAAAAGVQVAGFLAPIPILTRGLQFIISPLQAAWPDGWKHLLPIETGRAVSLGLFALVLILGVLAPRFWCRYLCPTGALLSAVSWLRLAERKVGPSCVGCSRCAKACSFGAVREDFSTRPDACTFCQDCGGACPAGAVQFAGRWDNLGVSRAALSPADEGAGEDSQVARLLLDGPQPGEVPLTRRGFVFGAACGVAAAVGVRLAPASAGGDGASAGSAGAIVRPPGSVPEEQFLALCVRCGSCMRACPTGLLQPCPPRRGIEALWTPLADTGLSGCDPTCNNCGLACPTGAIRPLPLAEKQAVRMGQAVVDQHTCLPYAAGKACQLCVDACHHAGHDAMEFLRLPLKTDEHGLPGSDGGGVNAPVVLKDKCVGCGLCQARCQSVNAGPGGPLRTAAIAVQARRGEEDRIARGSYLALRKAEADAARQSPKTPGGGAASQPTTRPAAGGGNGYVTDF